MANTGSYTGPRSFDAYDLGNRFWTNDAPGPRNVPGGSKYHQGADYGTRGATGVPVLAAMGGIVNIFPKAGGFGMYMTVTTTMPDGSAVEIAYGHVMAASGLKTGDAIQAGQAIGTVEDKATLISQGGTINVVNFMPHAHIEIRVNDVVQNGKNGTDTPYTFDNWQGQSHIIGTDAAGNPLIAQSSGSIEAGTYTRTVDKFDKTTGALIGSYVDRTEALDDGSGHLTGYKVTTQSSVGEPLIISTLAKDGTLVRQTTIADNGNTIGYTQAGIRIDVGTGGQKTAYVPGYDSGIIVAANGDIVLSTSSGNITLHLADDPLNGTSTCTAGGKTYNFSGSESVAACLNGVMIYGAGEAQVTDRLIDGSGQGTQFNYERGNDGAWPDPALSPFQHGADGSDGEWNLVSTEPILLAYNGSGTMSDVPVELFTLATTLELAASQTDPTDSTSAPNADNATLISTGTYEILGVGNVNTATGNEQAANAILSDDYRPGANDVLSVTDTALDLFYGTDQLSQTMAGAQANLEATDAENWVPVDPLVLDLNGDGVKLTSFGEAPVLFDIDHDGQTDAGDGDDLLIGGAANDARWLTAA